MASREKKPLAPYKSKQKANSDTGLPSNEVKNKKGKSLPSIKQQQLAREIFDTVATGSQLPVKLEASLPRKKVLKTLKRKQKLRVSKANLKSKVTKKVTSKNIRRIVPDIKKSVKTKRAKQLEEPHIKAIDISPKLLDSQTNGGDNDSRGADATSKSAKNNLRTKKTKSVSSKSVEESGSEDIQDTKEEASSTSSLKGSPKLSKKQKVIESPDSLSKSAKTSKPVNLKKTNLKDRENLVKVTEVDIKSVKGRKSTGKELDCGSSVKSNSNVEKYPKTVLDNKSSIDLTIDEVIASMLSDSEVDSQQSITEKIEGKVTRSRKMLIDENIASDIEIKKEPDNEDMKVTSDGEYTESDQGIHFQSAIQLRKRSKLALGCLIDQMSQRSLRNGKQRQLSDSGITMDMDPKKRRRLNSDDFSCNESQTVVASNREESSSVKNEISKNFDDDIETMSEIENNNNSDRMNRAGEIGPILRSKTKAKTAESEALRDDDYKIDEIRISPKCTDMQDDPKKINNLDQAKKDNILTKLTDKSKGRRNSINLDMKKTVNSFYSTDKSDSNSKSQIDQMIENIKLTIAKSIESKIFGPEKSLGLNKNFDVPKIEEIIAPLSTESQKMGLEESNDEDASTVTKNEITSESSENSVPKVADTAKEIEKLVMGDIEVTETHSQNVQENKVDIGGINNVHNTCESTCSIGSNDNMSCNNTENPEVRNDDCGGTSSSTLINSSDNESKATDENKKVVTRKSTRISEKSSENTSNSEAIKLNKALNKSISKFDVQDVPLDAQKSTEEEQGDLICKSNKESTAPSPELSHDNIAASPILAMASSEQAEEGSVEGNTQIRIADEVETDLSLNISDSSKESETLENISCEINKLVAENQSIPISASPADDIMQSKQVISDTKILDEECENQITNKQEVSALCDEMPVQSAASKTNGTPNKNQAVKTTEMSEEGDATCKLAQNTKHHKANNNHLSTTTNCDSNSDCNSVNPVAAHTHVSDHKNETGVVKPEKSKNHKDADKSNDDILTNRDITNPNENVSNKKSGYNEAAPVGDENNKSSIDKNSDEQKPVNEDNRRVLRTRDKQKKTENRPTSRNRDRLDSVKMKAEETTVSKTQNFSLQSDADEVQNSLNDTSVPESSHKTEDTGDLRNNNESIINDLLEPQARTRRSKEIRKRKEELLNLSGGMKNRRIKRDLRKSDQQNKEETLLDNEVAKINENNRSFLNKYGNIAERTDNFRGFSEGGQAELDKIESGSSLRSKSENDLTIEPGKSDERISRNFSDNHMSKQTNNVDILDNECKALKTLETLQKDSDEASTSGESSSSANITPKILETPEDKAKKESILRLLGLESLEKAAERLNHQKARKEQYTGTLKTIIRVQKEKEKDKDKRRSRSPLKMVLKQGRGDGEGDSPEFYTIQKEFGTSGLGDSSSGANRKFTTNHRYSCDEDNEEATSKDRQSLVIPEKSSSFSIHPGRLCADVCCYCFGKFGSLDTPMHLAQIKSDERRKKILTIERHLTKDSCLCDACYRHVDRKANTSPTNMQQKPQRQHRQLMVSKCSARECRDPARHHVKRRWLLKIKAGLQNQFTIDWESSQHTSMSFCVNHYGKIERFLTCALCKRRLARNHTHQLAMGEIGELNQLLGQQGIPVLLSMGTFVCKLCRYFTQLQLKYKDVENMNANHKSFFKSYRKRILHYHDIEVLDNEDDYSTQNQTKDKEKRKKAKTASKSGSSKSPDGTTNSTSEKSTPEPNKNESTGPEMDSENRIVAKPGTSGENVTDIQYLGIDNGVETLKKRKFIETHEYSTNSRMPSDNMSEVVEILAMDKEVTLTRLPKRQRTNDIAPVVQRLGANPSISVRTLFPGEEEMNLHANVEFANVREITPQGWEKCATMIQYDRDTKLLWQELQRPYGNQSSFLRHLILLEKYYRSGDLILAPNASRNAINYSTSVQNRLISYEGPEKIDEPIMEPISSEYNNPRRLSGGYVLERERLALPSTSSTKSSMSVTSHSAKASPPRVLKLNSGVSIIKKPPPNLQRLNLPSTSAPNGTAKRKDGPKLTSTSGGKVFQLSEPELKRFQSLKRQKLMLNEKQSGNPSSNSGGSNSPPTHRTVQYQKTPITTHSQFQKHLRMQQEMLNRQSRGDFEPLICDMRMANENSPTQNLIHNLNLPKSIQVTTKPSNPILILPKIPKSLTVIPQTVTRPTDK